MYLSDTYFDGAKSIQIFDLPEVYYRPEKINLFGKEIVDMTPNSDEIMHHTFISNSGSGDTYGYYSGLKALHDLNGTSQVPVTWDIRSNKVNETKIYKDGTSKWVIKPAEVIIDSENSIPFEILDTLEDWYDYFEENLDIIQCIKNIAVNKLALKKSVFDNIFMVYDDRYSERTKGVINDVFT